MLKTIKKNDALEEIKKKNLLKHHQHIEQSVFLRDIERKEKVRTKSVEHQNLVQKVNENLSTIQKENDEKIIQYKMAVSLL